MSAVTSGAQTGATRVEVYRPRMLLIWASVLSGIIVFGLVFGGWALGPVIRARFTAFQLLTLLVIAGGGILIMMAMALSTVTITESGLSVRNAVQKRFYRWDEIADVRWGPGASWAQLIMVGDPNDLCRIPLLALQTVDRERTRLAVIRLKEALADHRSRSDDARAADSEPGGSQPKD